MIRAYSLLAGATPAIAFCIFIGGAASMALATPFVLCHEHARDSWGRIAFDLGHFEAKKTDFSQPQIGETRMECILRLFIISHAAGTKDDIDTLISQQCREP